MTLSILYVTTTEKKNILFSATFSFYFLCGKGSKIAPHLNGFISHSNACVFDNHSLPYDADKFFYIHSFQQHRQMRGIKYNTFQHGMSHTFCKCTRYIYTHTHSPLTFQNIAIGFYGQIQRHFYPFAIQISWLSLCYLE